MWIWALTAHAVSLTEIVDRHTQAVGDIDRTRCAPILQAFFDELEPIDPAEVDPAEVRKSGAVLIDSVFQYRLAVHSKLQELYNQHTLSSDCIQGARRADLAGRYLQDALYLALGEQAPSDWVVAPGLDFGSPIDDLRSGDLVVSRGDALSSAGIAHMGRIDSQFSHNALIYVDAAGRAHTVEAYLERGAITQDAEDFLEHHLGRMVVLRYRDPELSALAARRAYERVRNGSPFDYDADFDADDHRALFCSEVGPWAFGSLVADGPLDLPFSPTVFDTENNAALFSALGIPVAVTSAPADLLYDPRFEIVAEWRDVSKLDSMRRHDAVVESLFTWMEELDYKLDSPGFDRFFVSFGLTMRRAGFFPSRLHPRGDKEFLTGSLTLQTAGLGLLDAFEAELDGADTQQLTYQGMRDILEGIRERDLEAWRSGGDVVFHDRLHP